MISILKERSEYSLKYMYTRMLFHTPSLVSRVNKTVSVLKEGLNTVRVFRYVQDIE